MNPDPPLVPPAFRGPIGRRIRFYRERAVLTQMQLAERAGVNQGFLSDIERGKRNPSASSLQAIAVALEVPPAVLIGEGRDHDSPQPLDTRELPVFAGVPAGNPFASGEQLEMFPVLRHLWAPNRYCLRLSFDSMEPTLKPGDLVLVEYRADVNPEHVQGRICACLVEDAPTIRRISVERRDERRLIILRGDNPAVPPLIVEEGRAFAIQGIVTHLVSRPL
jgi:transcriptional regulator with XRE-family HTH domain